jgi:N-acyl-D-amino-acid deacylase
LSVRPKTTDDKAMLLVGLQRSGASEANIKAAAKAVFDLQRADGGWGGNANLDSEAFATGEALTALLDSRSVTPSSDAYQRGVRFLVETRAPDGSWHVRSRAPKFQPYFESGFPYGHDQWISVAASARAVVALAKAIP